ncbi:MAG: hypothetical protein AABX84_00915 [Nanoarchaeota archaeon]
MGDNFWGKSASINLGGCNNYISNPRKIQEFINRLCKEIRMTKQGPLYLERFGYGDLLGFSCMQLIY